MNIKRASKEMSYRALKIGNGNVKWLSEKTGTDNGFDLVSVEGKKRDYIGVKATEDTDIFNITANELRVMKDFCGKEDSYLIHRYRFEGDKVIAFNIYEYDQEHNALVDIIDNTKVCSILPIKGTAQFACTPAKITKKYELK